MKREFPTFETEAALCQAFLRGLPSDWIAYPETGGWDILLVHRVGGWQIGVEAKLTLNAKVIEQAIRGEGYGLSGPDFRALLVGRIVAENAVIARALGLTVISPKYIQKVPEYWQDRVPHGPKVPEFSPSLPEAKVLERIGEWWDRWDQDREWFDRFPTERVALPDYLPEVAAGVPSPMILSDWKIKAMRVCVWVEKHGSITRAIFRDLGIDPSRWMNGVWLEAGAERGVWVAGKHFPGDQLRREHPNVFAKIEKDYPEWSKKVKAA